MNKKITIIFLFLLVPLSLWAVFQNHDLRRAAFGTKADIKVDVSSPGGNLNSALWQNFSQGGEETRDIISPISQIVKELNPQLIRIDHLFDHHVKVSGNQYDFSQLDQIIKGILQTGAKPMLSLSYMPPELAADGQNTSPPASWENWHQLVRATVDRYSGKSNFNISGIYYEVWNEPDLFGEWHYSKNPNYLSLYYHTASVIKSTSDTNNLKIGGPATTGFYPNWLKALLDYCSKNDLPIDFVSWHRYSENLEDYLEDFDQLNQILTNYPDYFNLERIISEFGPDSENSPWYDNRLGAIHSLAGITRLSGKVHRVFTFEIKDGPDPQNQQYWGRWGLLTHENHGLVKKPRFSAYNFLNQLTGKRLPLEGEGSWVSAMATRQNNKIQVLLVNYDPANNHYENTPVEFKNVPPGTYQVTQKYFLGNETRSNLEVNNGQARKEVILSPNSAVLLELKKI